MDKVKKISDSEEITWDEAKREIPVKSTAESNDCILEGESTNINKYSNTLELTSIDKAKNRSGFQQVNNISKALLAY
jgi:hypothetical protein